MAEPELNIPSDLRKKFVQKITAAFDVFDISQNKTCDPREVGTIIRSLGIFPSEEELGKILKEMEDDEPTGYIRFEKLSATALKLLASNTYPRDNEETIYRAFQTLDVDRKGFLTTDELRGYMTSDSLSKEELEEMLTACTDPASGKIFYEEFVTLLAQ